MTGLRDYYEPDCDVIDLSSTLKEGEEKIIDIVNLKRNKPLKIIGKIILKDRAKLTIVNLALSFKIIFPIIFKGLFLFKLTISMIFSSPSFKVEDKSMTSQSGS